MAESKYRWDGYTAAGNRKLVVNGTLTCEERYGDPGDSNNCLIDSLRQCLRIESDNMAVRRELQVEFANAVGAERVTANSYLEVTTHAMAIVRALFKHNRSNRPKDIDPYTFCVVGLSANAASTHGDFAGNVASQERLFVMNIGNCHFNAVIPI